MIKYLKYGIIGIILVFVIVILTGCGKEQEPDIEYVTYERIQGNAKERLAELELESLKKKEREIEELKGKIENTTNEEEKNILEETLRNIENPPVTEIGPPDKILFENFWKDNSTKTIPQRLKSLKNKYVILVYDYDSLKSVNLEKNEDKFKTTGSGKLIFANKEIKGKYEYIEDNKWRDLLFFLTEDNEIYFFMYNKEEEGFWDFASSFAYVIEGVEYPKYVKK